MIDIEDSTDEIFHLCTKQLPLESIEKQYQVNIKFKLYDGKAPDASIVSSRPRFYQIYIPRGLIKRLILLSALSFYAKIEKPLSYIFSFTDRRDLPYYVPVNLRPIFSRDSGISESYIAYILGSNRCEEISPRIVKASVARSVLFLLYHELGHALHGHVEYKRLTQRDPNYELCNLTIGHSREEVYEGFEVAADKFAAVNFARHIHKMLLMRVFENFEAKGWEGGDPRNSELFIHELGEVAVDTFANTMTDLVQLVTLFDPRNRSLDKKGDGYYPHPLLRYTLVTREIASILGEVLDREQESYIDFEKLLLNRSIISAGFMANCINTIWMDELEQDKNNRLAVPDNAMPLCGTRFEKSPFNVSIFEEYVFQAKQKGERVEYILKLSNLMRADHNDQRRTLYGNVNVEFNEFIQSM